MVKLTLRGGNGSTIKTTTKPTAPRKLTEADLAQIRAQREAQFDREAEQEARAVSRHRQMTPARERKFMMV